MNPCEPQADQARADVRAADVTDPYERWDPAGWMRAVEFDEQREAEARERGALAPVDA